jgi:hypothetical protein
MPVKFDPGRYQKKPKPQRGGNRPPAVPRMPQNVQRGGSAPSGGNRPSSAPAARATGNQPPVLPEPPKAPASVTWLPGIDPNRQSGNNRPGVNIPFLNNLGFDDTEVNAGDLFPNVQQALRPIFKPNEVAAERGEIEDSDLETAREQMREAKGVIPKVGAWLGLAGKNVANAAEETTKKMGGAQTFGRAVTGIPEGLFNLASVPGQVTENVISTVAQSVGISPRVLTAANPMSPNDKRGGQNLYMQGINAGFQVAGDAIGVDTRAAPKFLTQTAAKVINQIAGESDSDSANWLREQAVALTTPDTSSLGASAFAELVATVAVHAENLGVGTGALDHILNVIAPDQREVLIENARQLVNERDKTNFANMYYAGTFGYESTERMLDARAKLDAGMPIEQVLQEVGDNVTTREILRDVGFQLVYDPLNLFDAGLTIGTKGVGWMNEAGDASKLFTAAGEAAKMDIGTPLTGGGITARIREWANTDVGRLVIQTPDGNGLKVWEAWNDIEPPTWLEKLPGVGKVVRRLPETRAARLVEEASGLVGQVLAEISPDAGKNLARMGIKMNPAALALEVMLDPNATDVAKLGRSADELREVLGLAARAVSPEEAKMFGIAGESVYDLFRSDAADRTRMVLGGMQGNGLNNLSTSYDEVAKLYDEALTTGKAVSVTGDKETIRKGVDALDAADEAMEKWMERLDGAMKEATGYKPPNDALRWVKRNVADPVQGVFASLFHMGLNPGYAIRNFLSNNVSLFLDGINAIAPNKTVQSELARLDLLSPALARQGGSLTDGLGQQAKNVVMKAVDRFGTARAARQFEREAGQKAVLEGFNRVMRRNWKIGTAIPAQSWAKAEAELGDLAPMIRTAIENARTQADLAKIRRGVQKGEAWRLLDDTGLASKLDEAGIASTVQDILESATDADDAFRQINDLIDLTPKEIAQRARTMPIPRDTVEGQIVEEFAKLVDAFGDAETYDAFRQKQAIWQVTMQDVKARVQHAINNIPDPAQSKAMLNRFIEIEKRAEEAYNQTWRMRDQIIAALKARDLQAAAEVNGIFRNAADIGDAWDRYRLLIDSGWDRARSGVVDEFMKLGDTAGWASRPNIGQIEDYSLINPALQQDLMDVLLHFAKQNDFKNISHLRNFLKRQGLLDADKFFSVHIVNKDWYGRAVEAISAHRDDIKKTAQNIPVAQFTDEQLEALAHRSPAPRGIPQPSDVIGHQVAEAVDREGLLAEVTANIFRRADDAIPAMTPEQIEALDGLIKEVAPRLAATRTVAKNVGGHMRDFALHNYSDKRGFDLLLSMIYNYPTWHTRTMANFVKRAMTNPGSVAALIKLRRAVRRENRNLPEWWQDQISLDILGHHVYLPLLASLDPLNGLFGDKFMDSDLNNTPLGAFFAEAQRHGPGLHAGISIAMALSAAARGKREEQLGWMGSLGTPTRGINALSVLGRAAGLDFIPPGGVGPEFWLWQQAENGDVRFVGTKWEARRIGLALAEMAAEGTITKEQMYDAMMSQQGAIYDEALQRSKVNSALQTVASWLFGAGVKPRAEMEIEVQRMDAQVAALYEVRPGSGSPNEMTAEQYRQAWAQIREDYPFADAVRGFRRDETERQEIYVWSVFNRLPPNPKPYFEALGVNPDIYQALLDKFYSDGGIGSMSDLEREDFLNVMKQMGAILAIPSDATADEWEMARTSRRGMYEALDREFPNASDLQDQYFYLLNNAGRETAQAFLEGNGELQAYWDRKDQMLAADPILAQYYASMNNFESLAQDQFEADMESRYPGIHDTAAEYYAIKDVDPERAKDYLSSHPELKAYWSAKDAWVLQLDEQLMGMTEAIRRLDPQWASLRGDAEYTHPGQSSIATLIASGQRPLGEFELPEDLDARQIRAGISQELNEFTESGGNFGALYRALREMGDLDDVLTAYQELGGGSAALDYITANPLKFRALLTAIASLREGGVNMSGGGGGGGGRSSRAPRHSGGGGGGGSSDKVRSERWGGSSREPQNEAQENRQMMQIGDWLEGVKTANPTWWSLLRNMSGMDQAAIQALLDNPTHWAFRRWLVEVMKAMPLSAILEFFKMGGMKPRGRSQSSRNRGRSNAQPAAVLRVSNPLL